MEIFPGNAQHIGRREVQQDAFGYSDLSDAEFRVHGGVLAIVADGMGGLEHGDRASRAAVSAMSSAYRAKRADESIPDALLRAAESANDAVFALGESAGASGDIGTTLVAAVIRQRELYWFSIGDSALLLLRNGALTLLNEEHNYARELRAKVLAGELTADEASEHPERGSLTSYVGMKKLGEADRSLRAFPLQPGDQVLLASDGLTKSLAPDEIVAAFRSSPQESCEALIEAAAGKGLPDQDNVTALCIEIPASGPARPVLPPTKVLAESREDQAPPPAAPAAVASSSEAAAPASSKKTIIWALTGIVVLVVAWVAWTGFSAPQPSTDDGPVVIVAPPDAGEREDPSAPGTALPVEKVVPEREARR